MEAKAKARYVRVTPPQGRALLAGRARGARASARTPATAQVGRVLSSAMANAESTGKTTESPLGVSGAGGDEGPTLKRFRPRAKGRGSRINKKTSHITVIV